MTGPSSWPGLHIEPAAACDGAPERDMTLLPAPPGLDCRVRLLVVFAGAFCAFFLQSEWCIAALALLCAAWLCSFGKLQGAVTFAVLYLLLTWITVSIPFDNPMASFRILTNLLRRFMMPAFFAMPLATASTGLLLATLNRLHIPRPVTVSMAVVFRFMPTVAGEYQAIRTAQKFRGIGINVWALLRHPAQSYETILVPLLMRTMKIADELAASAMLRGAAESGPMTSWHRIRFSGRDLIVAVACLALAALLIALDFQGR